MTDSTFKQGYEKLYEAGVEMEREAIKLQEAAQEGLGELADRIPTTRLDLERSELAALKDLLDGTHFKRFSDDPELERVYKKVEQVYKIETGSGGRFA